MADLVPGPKPRPFSPLPNEAKPIRGSSTQVPVHSKATANDHQGYASEPKMNFLIPFRHVTCPRGGMRWNMFPPADQARRRRCRAGVQCPWSVSSSHAAKARRCCLRADGDTSVWPRAARKRHNAPTHRGRYRLVRNVRRCRRLARAPNSPTAQSDAEREEATAISASIWEADAHRASGST